MSISKKLRNNVRQRATERCEYCRLPEVLSASIFHIDHIIPEKHGGRTIKSNLALSCPWCNFGKSCNLTGIDAATRKIVPLYHPRLMSWFDHFAFRAFRVNGITPSGRATIRVLDFNSEDQLDIRRALFDAQLFRKVNRDTRLRELLSKLEARVSLKHEQRLSPFSTLELTDFLFDPYRTESEILALVNLFDRSHSND